MRLLNLKKQLILFAALFILLFTGCSSSNSSNASAQNIPSWYLNVPNNNAVYLYGAGEANNLQESKNMALNNLASKLSVNVSSVINTYKNASTDESGNSQYNKDISQDLQVEVEKMRFANYQVEKSTKVDNSFFTLVKISRSKLFDEKHKEFAILNNSIVKKLDVINSKPVLEQIQALQNLYPNLTRAKKESFILYTIQNDFDYSKYVTKYDQSIDKIERLKDKVVIELSTNEPSKFFSNELLALLNENKYKVSTQNSNTQINIQNNTRYSMARGWQIAKVTTNIATISNGRTISNTTINSVGRSTSSKQNAQASAAQHFKKQLYKLGLDTILFSK